MIKIIKNIPITCYSDLNRQNLIDLIESGYSYTISVKKIISIKASKNSEWILFSKFFQKRFDSYRDFCVSMGSIDVQAKVIQC